MARNQTVSNLTSSTASLERTVRRTQRDPAKKASALHAAYAKEELGRIEKLRQIDQAHKQGAKQGAIAQAVNLSQAEVSRILKRISVAPRMLDRSPREVILEWAAGELPHQAMLRELQSWHFSFARAAEPDNPLSVQTSGSWDQVTDAMRRGLIDYEDYDLLLDSVPGAK